MPNSSNSNAEIHEKYPESLGNASGAWEWIRQKENSSVSDQDHLCNSKQIMRSTYPPNFKQRAYLTSEWRQQKA